MPYMTWDQFKEVVETQLKKLGATGKEEIAFIDVDRPCQQTGIDVCISKQSLMRITY